MGALSHTGGAHRSNGLVVSGGVCLIALLLMTATACSTLPRDPEKTLEHVQQRHQVRVGLVENPPWVVRTPDEPAGVEVELARSFAQSLGASPEWFWGTEQHHMEALEQFELDLVIGGLEGTTPWSKTISLTRPYFEEAIVVGMPPGVQAPDQLNGVRVTVHGGDVAAAYLMKKDAIPVRVTDVSHAGGPVAAPAWRVEKMGFTPTQFRLLDRTHVMAVPPGENGWLKRLGDFLQSKKTNVEGLLEASEAHK
jgi:polar amino acid transport system substrate-binding protein